MSTRVNYFIIFFVGFVTGVFFAQILYIINLWDRMIWP
jgi:hypothetical protein